MASPPAKRQRRSKVVFSDEEEDAPETAQQEPSSRPTTTSVAVRARNAPVSQKSTKSTSTGSKSKSRPSTKVARDTTPRKVVPTTKTTSPNKPKKSPRQKKTEENSKSLHKFFGRASEEERWNKKAVTPTEEIQDADNGDAIEDDDDSLESGFSQLTEGQEDVKYQLDRRKDRVAVTQTGSQRVQSSFPGTAHKFVKPPLPGAREIDIKLEPDNSFNKQLHRPWADRYGPSNLEELAVHKKKVADVQKWLGEVLSGRDPRRILVLKGPAGSGKTTSVSLLSTMMGFQPSHWFNPTVSDTNMTASVASQFEDFVNRSGNFGSLVFDASGLSASDAKPDDYSELLPRVLIVEEFPTNMTRSSSALEAFRNVLLRYLAAGRPESNLLFRKNGTSHEIRPPVILIISETLLTSATASADSFTAHRLLGPEITNHPLVTIMEFNTVAPSFIAKALDLIIKKEARDSQRRRVPGPAVLKKLSEMGDIRSAANALEFLCARSADNDDWGGRVAAKMKRSGKHGVALTPMEKNSLELVTQREATLGMFHAVGKVVYNKRDDPRLAEQSSELPPQPPDHLAHMHRPKSSQVNIDDLMDETGTDIPTFLSTLHENYILSCNGLTFLESCDDCLGALSDSDILSPERNLMSRIGQGRGLAGSGLSHASTVDMLRQNEICFHVAVRGLLFALPHPVTRAAYPGGGKGDTFKMFYPTSLRMWKPIEEIDSLVSTLILQDMYAGLPGMKYGQSLDGGVASWKQKNNALDTNAKDDDASAAPRILASRAGMLFDRLPYLSKLELSKELDMRKVKQVAQFRGTVLPGEEDSEEGGIDAAFDLSGPDENTDRATTAPKKRDRIIRVEPNKDRDHSGAVNKNSTELERLYISDDDIQDD